MTVRSIELARAARPRNVWEVPGRVLYAVLRFFLIGAAATMTFIVFFLLNRTTVRGWKNIQFRKRGVLYACADHGSMFDSWPVGAPIVLTLLLRGKWGFAALPYNVPDAQNFLSAPIIGFFVRMLKGVGISRTGRKAAVAAYETMTEILAIGNLLLFMQGGRRPPGAARGPGSGAGRLILEDHTDVVVPVALTGTGRVQPYRKSPGDPPWTPWRLLGKRFEWIFQFRTFKHVEVTFGAPIDPETLKLMAEATPRADATSPHQHLSDVLFKEIYRIGNIS